MLDREEELRLAACIDVLRHDIQEKNDTTLKNETSLWLALKLKEANERLKHHERNNPLGDERKTIDAAKKLLMRKLNLTEIKAYSFIRKTAMDMGTTRYKVALDIIENEG